MTPITAILVDPDPSQREATAQVLAASGVAMVGQHDSIDALAALLRRDATARVAVVNLEPDPRETLRPLGRIVQQFPAVAFVALSRAPTAELVMDAMHLGVREFVPLPLDRSRLAAAVERLLESSGQERRARIIHVVPTIGGCGATTIACAVAASLSKLGKTLIVDLDLVRGAVANSFDVRPRHSVADAAAHAGPLDRARLESMLAVHRESGLSVLARPENPEDASRVTREGFANLLDAVGRVFDYVVLDSAMALDPPHAAAALAADLNVLVMHLTVPSAKNTERYLHALHRMGVDATKTRVVVNRYVPGASDIQPSEVERALGLKIAWTLPNDFATAMGSINFGEPATLRSPRTDLSRSLAGLAEMLAGRGEGPAEAPTEARHQMRSPT